MFEVKATTDTTTSQRSYQVASDSFVFNTGDLDPKWKHPENGEAIIYHYWTDTHLPIKAIDGKRNVISFGYPSGKVFRDGFEGDLARYVVENIYEALDLPGEWVLERSTGRLFYMPLSGEDMASAEVIAPATEELISIKGDPLNGKFVEYLNFEGLGLAYSNFNLPWGDCNNGTGSASVSACVNLSGARNCSFDRCSLRNLGTFGFELFDGCTFNRFTCNTLEQIAAGGFRLRGVEPGGNPALRTGNNTISDNTIGYYGLTYPSAVGVLVMHSDCNTVAHNLIHHGDYTGISVGWSWSYLRSAARGNRIEQNHIHDIGYNNLLSDMGGIYTLGLSPGTVISNNLVHDVNANRYGGWGIYTDEGSTSILIENNIVYHTKFGTFNIHYAKDLVVRNNIFALGTAPATFALEAGSAHDRLFRGKYHLLDPGPVAGRRIQVAGRTVQNICESLYATARYERYIRKRLEYFLQSGQAPRGGRFQRPHMGAVARRRQGPPLDLCRPDVRRSRQVRFPAETGFAGTEVGLPPDRPVTGRPRAVLRRKSAPKQ